MLADTGMRILYVNYNLLNEHSAPGIWGRQVLQGLRAANADVINFPLLTDPGSEPDLGNDGVGRFRSLMWAQFSKKCVARLLEQYLMARGVVRTFRSTFRIWRLRRKFDVDVVLGRQGEYDLSPQIAARILRRPLVLEVHSPHYLERQLRGQPASRLLHKIERWQLRQCRRIWVNSEELKNIVSDNGIPSDLIRVIPFGVDLERVSPRIPRRSGDPVRIIFVGSFSRWHGVTILLRAFAAARQRVYRLHLTLVGDGAELAASKKQSDTLGIADAVEFTGWLANDRVIERLENADIGVAPYACLEPFYFDPAKIIEYMASGLAVVASDQGRISEMVQHGRTGLLVPPGDESALEEALVMLAENRALLERFGSASRRRAETKHDGRKFYGKVLALCAEAAAGRP